MSLIYLRSSHFYSNLVESKNETWQPAYSGVLHLSSPPNFTVMYRILLLLVVTICSAERTMSGIRLRSSMGDSWLSNLLVLSCNSDILENIFQCFQNNEIIEAFAKTTPQRRKLISYKRS